MVDGRRIYQIACSLPALCRKGVEDGDIPGIDRQSFGAETLSKFLYHGAGGALSTGEFLLLEFLLNLYHPGEYRRFNFGHAVNIWDWPHMAACLKGVEKIYKEH